LDASEKEYLHETIKDITIMMSDEWLKEGELSSKFIQINSPSSSLHCRIKNQDVDVLYNPTVGANLISDEFALAFLGDEVLVLTDRKLKRSAGSFVSSYGGDKKMCLYDTMMSLSFWTSMSLRMSTLISSKDILFRLSLKMYQISEPLTSRLGKNLILSQLLNHRVVRQENFPLSSH